MSDVTRRSFLGMLPGAMLAGASAAEQKPRFFTVGQRKGRWWLITPDDQPSFSIGLNHIDPSPLRIGANGELWQQRYGNSMERWLKEAVAPDLKASSR